MRVSSRSKDRALANFTVGTLLGRGTGEAFPLHFEGEEGHPWVRVPRPVRAMVRGLLVAGGENGSYLALVRQEPIGSRNAGPALFLRERTLESGGLLCVETTVYSLLGQATLTERLMESLGMTQVHVLSHDFGVSVVQELLARQLEREEAGQTGLVLRSSCFLNGGLFPEVYQSRLIQRLLASPVGPLVSRLAHRQVHLPGVGDSPA